MLLLGDFNIFSAEPTNAAYSAIIENGFVIPQALQAIPQTNVSSGPRFHPSFRFSTVP